MRFVDDFRTIMLYTRNTYHGTTRTLKTATCTQSTSNEHDVKTKKCTDGNVVVTSNNYFCWDLVALYRLYCVSHDDSFFNIIYIQGTILVWMVLPSRIILRANT